MPRLKSIANNKKLKCYWCTRGMVDKGLVIPTQAEWIPQPDHPRKGRWKFKGMGQVHNLQCLRAYVVDAKRKGILIPQIDHLMELYAEEVQGYKGLPPPALARELLEEFNGPWDWDTWRAKSMTPEMQEAWKTHACVEDTLSRFGERKMADSHKIKVHEYGGVNTLGTVGLPGETHVFDNLFTIHSHANRSQ